MSAYDKTVELSREQRRREQGAFGLMFVVFIESKPIGERSIALPPNFFGQKKFSLKKGRFIVRRYNDGDKITPKDIRKAIFLGPKVIDGHRITFSDPYRDAAHLPLNNKVEIVDVRCRHRHLID